MPDPTPGTWAQTEQPATRTYLSDSYVWCDKVRELLDSAPDLVTKKEGSD